MKKISIALALAGLVLATLLVAWFGLGHIASAVLSVGAGGFALFCAWQVATMGIVGLGWRAVAPPHTTRSLWPFVWGRMVRDSAAACLPFSTVGGFVLGTRAAALYGVGWATAALSMVVDLTAEFLAEIAFAAGGLLVLLARSAHSSFASPIAGTIAAMAVLGVAAVLLRKEAVPLFVRLGRHIFGKTFAGRVADGEASEQDLAEIYGHTGRLLSSTAIHFAGWICKGLGNWIAFRLLGSDISLLNALAIEALLHAFLIPAFVVPGYIGVQEAGYAAIGALFGIRPEIALAVSLIRRARDIALGTPILLIWQVAEVRRLSQPK